MTAFWIVGGAVGVLAAIAAIYAATLYVVMFVLRIVSVTVFERKFASKIMLWWIDRYGEKALVALAIIGWFIVILTIAVLFGVPAFVIYFFLSIL